MNKNEVIGKIKSMGTISIYSALENQRHDMIIKSQVLDIISQIDKPQKVVLPKFVAEWLEYCKHDKFYALHDAYANMDEELECWCRFMGNNSDLFAKAWLDGYEIEPEKLYTVEIPNPNNIGAERTVLMKNGFNQIVMLRVYDHSDNWRTVKGYQLTETEIKKDFEWAWQFAKEVE